MAALYPTSVTTQLFQVQARAQSTLTADIDAVTTSWLVVSTAGWPDKGFVVCENETAYYSAKTSTSLTVQRGFAGTAVSHVTGKAVKLAVVAETTNRITDEVIAIQGYVGISGSAGTTTITYKLNNLFSFSQAGSTQVTNLNAQYIGGSSVGQINTAIEAAHKSGDNLLLNPEFQVGATANLPLYWTIAATPTLALAADTLAPALGGNQVTITAAGAGDEGICIPGAVANWLKVKPSTTYTFSIYYKVTDASDRLNIIITSFNGATGGTVHLNITTLGSTTATRYTFTFTTDVDATNLQIYMWMVADGDIVIVSHPKLEEGSVATPFEPALVKRPVTRCGSVASHATPSIDTNLYDFFHITAQAEAITSMTTNLTGTNAIGQKLWIAITGTAARAIAWGASFEASTIALPTTTVTTARLDIGFVWTGTKWRCVGVA